MGQGQTEVRGDDMYLLNEEGNPPLHMSCAACELLLLLLLLLGIRSGGSYTLKVDRLSTFCGVGRLALCSCGLIALNAT